MIDFPSAAPTSVKITPITKWSLYQPLMSVSRIEWDSAVTTLLKTLCSSPFLSSRLSLQEHKHKPPMRALRSFPLKTKHAREELLVQKRRLEHTYT